MAPLLPPASRCCCCADARMRSRAEKYLSRNSRSVGRPPRGRRRASAFSFPPPPLAGEEEELELGRAGSAGTPCGRCHGSVAYAASARALPQVASSQSSTARTAGEESFFFFFFFFFFFLRKGENKKVSDEKKIIRVVKKERKNKKKNQKQRPPHSHSNTRLSILKSPCTSVGLPPESSSEESALGT